jgi:hypothetical protein
MVEAPPAAGLGCRLLRLGSDCGCAEELATCGSTRQTPTLRSSPGQATLSRDGPAGASAARTQGRSSAASAQHQFGKGEIVFLPNKAKKRFVFIDGDHGTKDQSSPGSGGFTLSTSAITSLNGSGMCGMGFEHLDYESRCFSLGVIFPPIIRLAVR